MFESMMDTTLAPNFILLSAQRWLNLRLELIGSTLIFFVALAGVLSRFSISESLLGLSIGYCLQANSLFSMCVKLLSESETAMSSTERIQLFIHSLEKERNNSQILQLPIEVWPSHGAISIQNVHLRYRPELPLVLKDICLHIEGNSNVAFVGRTGSGKSSIALSLLRTQELTSGVIFIDGIDISKIDIETLRNNIAIVPQEPGFL